MKSADTKVFPVKRDSLTRMFRVALRKAKLNQKARDSDRFQLHPHSLRKYFRTHLARECTVDVVEQSVQKSLENMVQYYEKELIKVHKTGKTNPAMNSKVFKRLKKGGFVKASGKGHCGLFSLTPRALELLGL